MRAPLPAAAPLAWPALVLPAVAPASIRHSSAASCSAVFAPEPPAGLIAWMASPSTVTRLGGQAGTGTEVRTRTRNVSSTSASACSARRSGCQVLIRFADSACSAAGLIAPSSASGTPRSSRSPVTAHIR